MQYEKEGLPAIKKAILFLTVCLGGPSTGIVLIKGAKGVQSGVNADMLAVPMSDEEETSTMDA